jgi:hypothetical protein
MACKAILLNAKNIDNGQLFGQFLNVTIIEPKPNKCRTFCQDVKKARKRLEREDRKNGLSWDA